MGSFNELWTEVECDLKAELGREPSDEEISDRFDEYWHRLSSKRKGALIEERLKPPIEDRAIALVNHIDTQVRLLTDLGGGSDEAQFAISHLRICKEILQWGPFRFKEEKTDVDN